MTLYEPAANETYPDSAQAGIMRVADAPVSTFSADVDTASYSLARSSLMAGFLPDPQSVRPEEFVNYFTYAYPAPKPMARPSAPPSRWMRRPGTPTPGWSRSAFRAGWSIWPNDRPSTRCS
ncbi:MAG: von Willebrand factor type A domain-containing protein [Rhodobacteraceae bacterium]|nr:von Willebrand factor type A domain-containing protein [Paracoccaceae bacterium]